MRRAVGLPVARESRSPTIAAPRSNRSVRNPGSRLQVFAPSSGKGNIIPEDETCRPHALAFLVQPRRRSTTLQGKNGPTKAVTRHDDGVIGGDEIFFCPGRNRADTLLNGGILHGDADDTAIGAARLLRGAVNPVIIIYPDSVDCRKNSLQSARGAILLRA